MRDERVTLVITRALSKRIGKQVSVIQDARYTEWMVEGRMGFAIGPCITSYPPKRLLDMLEEYFTREIKREADMKAWWELSQKNRPPSATRTVKDRNEPKHPSAKRYASQSKNEPSAGES